MKDEKTEYTILVNTETGSEEELINLGNDINDLHVIFGHIPEADKYRLITNN